MSAAPARWLPAGTVYGTLLNFRREWDLWAPKMTEAPYKAAPKAPVLYVRLPTPSRPAAPTSPCRARWRWGRRLVW